MLRIFLAFVTIFYAAVCFAVIDVNKANDAELDSIKGIGPSLSGKILDERKKGSYKDWNDFIARVKGLGKKNAVRFSAEGLTVNGAGYKEAIAAPVSIPAGK
jgi:competence protein ComEA